jgi:hypothetical protein
MLEKAAGAVVKVEFFSTTTALGHWAQFAFISRPTLRVRHFEELPNTRSFSYHNTVINMRKNCTGKL